MKEITLPEFKTVLNKEVAMYLMDELIHDFLERTDLELEPLLITNIHQIKSIVIQHFDKSTELRDNMNEIRANVRTVTLLFEIVKEHIREGGPNSKAAILLSQYEAKE